MNTINKKVHSVASVLWRAIGSNWFWRVAIALFVVQGVYIAVVGRYSMAFDEYYHLGLIQAYAKVWFPWLVQQPPGPAEIGAITADGSYLYHYVMSFPYRALEFMTASETARIIVMRILDVGIFTGGLYVFRKLLLELGAGRAIANAIMLITMAIPISAWLAGQLTYDVLWFTLTGYTMLVLARFIKSSEASKKIPLRSVASILALLLLGAQVKYASLPLLLAAALFLVGWLAWLCRSRKFTIKTLIGGWRHEIRSLKTIAAVVLLLVSTGLFLARYGVNIVRYHNPVPACDAVLSVERCEAYGPFGRNQDYKERKLYEDVTLRDKLTYPFGWYGQMVWETYFAVSPREVGYKARSPLPLPYVAGYVLIISMTALVLLGVGTIWRGGTVLRLLFVMSMTYVGFLFYKNITGYIATGVPVAIHGRYVLALVPVFGWLAYYVLRAQPWFMRTKKQVLLIVIILVVLTLYGSGVAVYAIRADADWYWTWAQPAAQAVQTALRAVVIH